MNRIKQMVQQMLGGRGYERFVHAVLFVPAVLQILCTVVAVRLRMLRKRRRKVFLLDTSDHNNLGDAAIGLAEQTYLANQYPGWIYVACTTGRLICAGAWGMRRIAALARPGDVVFLNGGGNLGTRYPQYEGLRQSILRHFPMQRVITFPLSCCVDQEMGDVQAFLKSARDVYQGHKDFTLFIRGEESLVQARQFLPTCDIRMCPDIVLTLASTLKLPEVPRQGIFFCLRTDSESRFASADRDKVVQALRAQGADLSFGDMLHSGSIPLRRKADIVHASLEKFSRFELVVTDRMHGMILCALTCTPCIALQTYNHKLTEGHRWLSNLAHIRLVDRLQDVPEVAMALRGVEAQPCPILDFSSLQHAVDATKQGASPGSSLPVV